MSRLTDRMQLLTACLAVAVATLPMLALASDPVKIWEVDETGRHSYPTTEDGTFGGISRNQQAGHIWIGGDIDGASSTEDHAAALFEERYLERLASGWKHTEYYQNGVWSGFSQQMNACYVAGHGKRRSPGDYAEFCVTRFEWTGSAIVAADSWKEIDKWQHATDACMHYFAPEGKEYIWLAGWENHGSLVNHQLVVGYFKDDGVGNPEPAENYFLAGDYEDDEATAMSFCATHNRLYVTGFDKDEIGGVTESRIWTLAFDKDLTILWTNPQGRYWPVGGTGMDYAAVEVIPLGDYVYVIGYGKLSSETYKKGVVLKYSYTGNLISEVTFGVQNENVVLRAAGIMDRNGVRSIWVTGSAGTDVFTAKVPVDPWLQGGIKYDLCHLGTDPGEGCALQVRNDRVFVAGNSTTQSDIRFLLLEYRDEWDAYGCARVYYGVSANQTVSSSSKWERGLEVLDDFSVAVGGLGREQGVRSLMAMRFERFWQQLESPVDPDHLNFVHPILVEGRSEDPYVYALAEYAPGIAYIRQYHVNAREWTDPDDQPPCAVAAADRCDDWLFVLSGMNGDECVYKYNIASPGPWLRVCDIPEPLQQHQPSHAVRGCCLRAFNENSFSLFFPTATEDEEKFWIWDGASWRGAGDEAPCGPGTATTANTAAEWSGGPYTDFVFARPEQTSVWYRYHGLDYWIQHGEVPELASDQYPALAFAYDSEDPLLFGLWQHGEEENFWYASSGGQWTNGTAFSRNVADAHPALTVHSGYLYASAWDEFDRVRLTNGGGGGGQTAGCVPARTGTARLSVAPNPSARGTRLHCQVRREALASLRVLDVTGRVVRDLHRGVMAAGEHSFAWDGTGNNGRRVPAGVYLCVFESDNFRQTRRLVLTE